MCDYFRYSFYDGPPFATGLPHYGHILAGTIKVSSKHLKQLHVISQINNNYCPWQQKKLTGCPLN